MLLAHRGPAPFHRLTLNKRFEPVFSTVIMAVCRSIQQNAVIDRFDTSAFVILWTNCDDRL